MNAGHSIIGFDVAQSRRDDILREAAAARLVAEAHRARPSVGALRRLAGDALVRLGEHLQGARRHRLAGEPGAGAGSRPDGPTPWFPWRRLRQRRQGYGDRCSIRTSHRQIR